MPEFNEISARNIIYALADIANYYLPEPNPEFPIRFERIGEGTFHDAKISCVVRDSCLIVNIDWFTAADSQDIKYLIWHEMRHMYQQRQVSNLDNGGKLTEPRQVVQQWKHEFQNYIPNTEQTENAHFHQSIEFDAYVFSLALLALHCANSDGSVNIGLPDCIADKLINCCEQSGSNLKMPPYRKYKIEPNDPCPCGSGRKYKKCCRTKDFFI